MKKPGILLIAFLITFSFSKISAQKLPDRQQVLQNMLLANEYFMTKNPNVGKTLVTDRERPSNIWTRGVYYEGLMALHQIYPKEEFYDTLF